MSETSTFAWHPLQPDHKAGGAASGRGSRDGRSSVDDHHHQTRIAVAKLGSKGHGLNNAFGADATNPYAGSAAAMGVLEDVDAERDRTLALTDYSDSPIVVKGLKKIYPGLDGGRPKVRGVVPAQGRTKESTPGRTTLAGLR